MQFDKIGNIIAFIYQYIPFINKVGKSIKYSLSCKLFKLITKSQGNSKIVKIDNLLTEILNDAKIF